ncbi:MAG: 30S ribosomal protein S19e [Nanoarchaeota archaeon]
MSMYDVDSSELIKKLAEELKKIESIKPPVWAGIVKTGIHKERPPLDKGWWYIRAASILRFVNIRGPIGVHKLRIKYGGKKNRGVAAEHFYKASGNIIRKILQQLEKAELIKQDKIGVHKGRVVTPAGIKLLDSAAKSILKSKPAPKKQGVVEEIKEEKKELQKINDGVPQVKKEQTKEIVEKKEIQKEPKKEEKQS